MQLESTLSAAARPFLPQAAPLSSREDDVPRAYSARHRLTGSSPTPGLAADSPVGRAFPSHCQSSDNDGVSTDTSISNKPPAGGVGAEEVEVAGAAVTPMELAPLGGCIRKRMDFLVRSKYPNLGARRVILMIWPMPLGSGPAVSPTIVIIMRILISCPW